MRFGLNSRRLCQALLQAAVAAALLLGVAALLIAIPSDRPFFATQPERQMKNPKTVGRRQSFISKWSPANANERDSHRIYFHGARGKTALALVRQSCAVESAALHNPDRPIQLFISNQDPDGEPTMNYSTDPWLAVLERYPNVAVVVYDESDYFSGSPFDDWYHQGAWRNSSRNGLVHLTDYWRMLSSFRGGGFYMDLDVITFKRLDPKILWNFFSLEDRAGLNFCSGIFHMEAGHWLTAAMVKQLAAKTYDPKIYSAYGPLFVKKVLATHCGLELPDLSTNMFPYDVRVLPNHFFFPIPWTDWELFWAETENSRTVVERMVGRGYGVHVWNKFSSNRTLVKGSKSIYALLAAQHCPLTFAAQAVDQDTP